MQRGATEKVLSIATVLWKNLLSSCEEDELRLGAATRQGGSQRGQPGIVGNSKMYEAWLLPLRSFLSSRGVEICPSEK